jgi:hypothetical protein
MNWRWGGDFAGVGHGEIREESSIWQEGGSLRFGHLTLVIRRADE